MAIRSPFRFVIKVRKGIRIATPACALVRNDSILQFVFLRIHPIIAAGGFGLLSGGHTAVLLPAEEQEEGFGDAKQNAQHQKQHAVVRVKRLVDIIQRHVAEHRIGNGNTDQRQAHHQQVEGLMQNLENLVIVDTAPDNAAHGVEAQPDQQAHQGNPHNRD